ncbi:MAG: TonB-dependent receptor plug domain-containing protein [Armatimonadetes bacterium]|nr:TonB-dependent receptor plug domain-containing protein [Armatimonadota bacterium]
MPRLRRRALALAAASLAAAPLPTSAQTPAVPPGTPNSNIFDPTRAPEIVIRIGVRRYVLVPHTNGSETTISQRQIEQTNPQNFNSLVAAKTPGVAQAPSGEIHVRGSHGQYTYYLDGAPLPSNVGGSFSDLINPKDIETLRVYDGGFPAQYGGQLAAVFDVTTRGGRGRPNGFLQQLEQGYATHYSTAEVGGSQGDVSYFASAIRHSTDFYLSPQTQDPLHDSGLENVGFGKLVYQSGRSDRLILDAEDTGARIQVPNTPDRQAVGQDDIQKENSSFANLIWRHGAGANALNVALYSHQSRLRYFGSPQDLVAGPPGSASADPTTLDRTDEDQTGDYIGLRVDKPQQVTREHHVQVGVDLSRVTGHQIFLATGADNLSESRYFTGGDRSVYAQDDWTPGRFLVNYGARYDIHQAFATTSQLSPRLNVTYHAGRRDDLHAYYDRLFQPVNIEDEKQLTGANASAVAPIKPERDDFFEAGWEHRQGGATLTLDTYYRAEKDTVDDSTFANTQIDIPVNFQKGYTRGVEFAVDGPLVKSVSYYANYARSWAKEAGPVSGGLLGAAPTTYFYDDHDQTDTASFGVNYEARGVYANLEGEYGSGFPYGEIDDANGNPIALNYIRVEPHTTLNFTVGGHRGTTEVALVVNNVLNYAYIIKQAGVFSNTQWAPARTFGVKLTQSF